MRKGNNKVLYRVIVGGTCRKEECFGLRSDWCDVVDITWANEQMMFCRMVFAGIVSSVLGSMCP